MLDRAKIAYKQQGQTFPKQGTTNYQALRDNVVTGLVEQAELDQKAASMGVTVTQADIDARLKLLKQQYFGGSETKYRAEIKKQGFTQAQVISDVIRPQLISQKVQDQVIKDVKVTDADVDAYYKTNQSPYQHRSRATCATSSSARARRPRSRSTSSSRTAPTRRGAPSRRSTRRTRAARTAARRRSPRARRSRSSTRRRSPRPPNKVAKPFYDPTQYKAWFVIEPLGP